MTAANPPRSLVDSDDLDQRLDPIPGHRGMWVAICQFNVARNMALYTYFFYALAPEVQHKTFTVIEMALRERAAGRSKKKTLRPLLEEAVASGWISDNGFRHIAKPEPHNPYSRELPKALSRLRNTSAHGSTNLSPDTIWYLERCADLVNQLFPVPRALAPADTAGSP